MVERIPTFHKAQRKKKPTIKPGLVAQRTQESGGMSQVQAGHNCRDLKASLCYRDPVSKLKTKLGM